MGFNFGCFAEELCWRGIFIVLENKSKKKEESLLVVRNITSFVLPNKENDAIEFHRLVSIDR